MAKITREAFEERYARESGMTVEKLRELSFEVVPCKCDYEKCEGWAMQTHPTSEEIVAAARLQGVAV